MRTRNGTVRIRLLVDVAAMYGDVRGRRGDEFEVPVDVARAWCDGERAELADAQLE